MKVNNENEAWKNKINKKQLKKGNCDRIRCSDRRRCHDKRISRDITKDVIEGNKVTRVERCQKACSGAMVRKKHVIKIMAMRSARTGGSHTYEGIFVI